ncbi:MAG TPA: hypothetical protein VFC24_03035 [Casimicrobiaceae bacterium]|nr:hypothetical protein [Casimicrobiaceae bacterium]
MGQTRGLILLLAAAACDQPDRTAPLVLSDAQVVNTLSAFVEAELLEASPAQAGAYTPGVGILASGFINDETALLWHLQQLGTPPTWTPDGELARDDGRAEQIAMSMLTGHALDDHFLVRTAAAHTARVKFVRDQVQTRCASSSSCDAARAYVLQELQHLQRLSHP